MKRPHSDRHGEGFTLIELLVTVAVLAVLLAIAAPSFATLVRDLRLTTATNDLHAAMFFTRSEAVRRGRRVTICTSSDGQACAPGAGWGAGWIVFEDVNDNGVREEGEALLRVGRAGPPGVLISTNDPVSDYVSYVASGMTRKVGGALQMGTITVCSDGLRARLVVFNAAGRMRVAVGEVC